MKKISIRCRGTSDIEMSKLERFQGKLKKLPDDNLQKLKQNLIKNGFRIPIFIWKTKIMDGHGRLTALESLQVDGYEIPKIPVVELEADNEQDARKLLLMINSRYGKINEEGFYEFAESLDLTELKLELNIPEIKLMDEFTETTGADALPEIDMEKVTTKPGDIWELGQHRILCGDSQNKKDVELLFGKKVPVLLVTDPPYGVEYNPEWRREAGINKSKGRMGKVENDNVTDWTEAYRLSQAMAIYVWHPGKYVKEFQISIENAGYEVISQIIWAKDQYALSRGDYHWKHEPCFYANLKGSKHNWQGKRDQCTVWEINRVDKNEKSWTHGTQKPVECMERPIRNNSREGDIVYDAFIGSGTTLIASQKTGRICFGMEIMPNYVDVIVKRYYQFCKTNNMGWTVKRNGKDFDPEKIK
jgi:DNA modification methylase